MAQSLRVRFGQAIPVVMITADRSDQCRKQLQGFGVPVLNKPVKAGKMRSALSHLLGEKTAAQQA
ncbi:sensory box histidine kinase/response regulator [Pseudomonas sp. BAY1663]|nr:sensory box histidine kinase/response regulator [Pseudomonas sp. BAY1663]